MKNEKRQNQTAETYGLPPHLQENSRPVGTCDKCKRKTWAMGENGKTCRMPQPDGQICMGTFK